MSPSRLAVAAPRSVPRNISHAPLSVLSRSSSATGTPQFLAKAMAACVGSPVRIEGIGRAAARAARPACRG